jgi:hypothetical protein
MQIIRGDKTIRVIKHKYMEIPQGTTFCSCFCLKVAKMSCFSVYLFSSAKLENKRAEEVQHSGEG